MSFVESGYINRRSPWDEEDGASKKPSNKKDSFFDDKTFNLKDFINRKKPSNQSGKNFEHLWKLVIVALIGFWIISGFYTVQEGETALVIRFGKYVRTATTGLNYHLPMPFEEVFVESIEKIRKVEIGFRSLSQKSFPQNNFIKGNSTTGPSITEESLMLTEDENILDINFVVQWKISNLKDFAFSVSNPEETVKNAAESSMREVIANTKLAIALTEGRSKIQHDAKDLLQNMLDSYRTGVEVTALQMQKVDPPQEVTDAFRDVQTAKTDKERLINEAYSYKNDLLPRARGEAAKVVQEGSAYRTQVIEKALGDVSRFNAIYAQFRKASEVTKKRIYMETMESILQDMDKVIIDNKNSGIVPYLPLPKLDK